MASSVLSLLKGSTKKKKKKKKSTLFGGFRKCGRMWENKKVFEGGGLREGKKVVMEGGSIVAMINDVPLSA